jgi:HPt (histidine-containing phosphotransfer) domain-containing protein
LNQGATDPLAELTDRFIERTRADASRIRSLAAAMSQPSSPAYCEIRQLIHRMAGSAGTFGFDELSERAAKLDAVMNAGSADIDLIRSRLTPVLAEIDAMTSSSHTR